MFPLLLSRMRSPGIAGGPSQERFRMSLAVGKGIAKRKPEPL